MLSPKGTQLLLTIQHANPFLKEKIKIKVCVCAMCDTHYSSDRLSSQGLPTNMEAQSNWNQHVLDLSNEVTVKIRIFDY